MPTLPGKAANLQVYNGKQERHDYNGFQGTSINKNNYNYHCEKGGLGGGGGGGDYGRKQCLELNNYYTSGY